MTRGADLEVVEHAREGRKGYDVVIDGAAVIRDADALEVSTRGEGVARSAVVTFEVRSVKATTRAEGAEDPRVVRLGDRVVFNVERARELLSALLPWDVVALEVQGIYRRDDGALAITVAEARDARPVVLSR